MLGDQEVRLVGCIEKGVQVLPDEAKRGHGPEFLGHTRDVQYVDSRAPSARLPRMSVCGTCQVVR